MREEVGRKIWQWTAKTDESCSTDKMANILNYLLGLATHTHSLCPNKLDKLKKQQEKNKGKQLCLRKLSLCLCHDLQQKKCNALQPQHANVC